MKAPLSLLAALSLTACIGPHIATGATPASTADAFTCISNAVKDLGFTVEAAEPKTGYLHAERRDPGSPEGAEYTDLAISVYTNRDGETQFMIQTSRTLGGATPAGTSSGLPTMDSDIKFSDTVTARCGKH